MGDEQHDVHSEVTTLGSSRHLTVSLRDAGPVSDTLLQSGILRQVPNTSVSLSSMLIVSVLCVAPQRPNDADETNCTNQHRLKTFNQIDDLGTNQWTAFS